MKSILKKFGGTILAVCVLNLTILSQSCSQAGDVQTKTITLAKPIIWQRVETSVDSYNGEMIEKANTYQIERKVVKNGKTFYIVKFWSGNNWLTETTAIYVMEPEENFDPELMTELGYKRIQ